MSNFYRTFAPQRFLIMKKIIVLAEEGERALIDKLRDEMGIDFTDLPIVYTGVGAINIIRTLTNVPKDTEVYNIGYAGSANFNIGSWVEVTEARLNHPNVTYPEPVLSLSPAVTPDSIRKAICYTNTDFVLQSKYQDCVFDMELAFIASLGFTQLHSIKYVSDNLSLHAYHELTEGVQ